MTRSTTPSLDHTPPAYTQGEAERIARELFGVVGTASPLPSERDQNFLIVTDSAARFVLKLAHAEEERAALEAQNEAIERLAAAGTGYAFPRVVPTLSGVSIGTAAGVEGAANLARLLAWVPGVPLARVRPHDAALLRAVGGFLGALDRALEGFQHAAARRSLKWDLRHGRAIVEENIAHVDDTARRALLETFYAGLDLRSLEDLRVGVIHGDANDYNVLVREPAEDPLAPRTVAGIIDFGDLVESWVLGELAIGAAYAMLGKPDPLAAAALVAGGYHETNPLTEVETAALYPLIGLRLCTSAVLSAQQRRRRPENEYLSVSEEPVWALLQRLASLSPALAHFTIREACGLKPCPASTRVRRWLETHGAEVSPVLGPDFDAAETLTLDLTPGSLELDGLDARGDAAAWTDVIFNRMRHAGSTCAIGRYDEIRRWSTAEPFRVTGNDRDEFRTLHIGLDLFAEPGTPVYAPLDGVVHSLRDNAGAFDYGPTVLLEHVVPQDAGDDVRFHTLYGHLTRASLHALRPGSRLRRGDRIGAVGEAGENGGWAPHLHLQLIADLIGHAGEFPGVARPSERALWRSLSPDPYILAGVAPSDAREGRTEDERILHERERRIGPSLSISYRRPLHIVRGWMQHLYDAAGQPYLDAVNNVAHVGHAHPRVVDALRRQNAVLNTNTRYLHEAILRYAERLAALLPPRLDVLYFVCSGSEANELALRLARAHTGRRGVVVVDAAYHGNTSALIELSPYKFNGPGGAGPPPHVRVVPLPDPFRGLYRSEDASSGQRYARHVREALLEAEGRGQPAAAFFAEPLPGCGGQIVPPDQWLAECFRHARAAGAVCVADEVQTGFGRVGSHFWAFEAQNAMPDIVTMGKPIGNGHPMGAVATTREIAASFANGMEYFNTFGGNPVSCAVGLAVLDVLRDEALPAHALTVGERLRAGLRSLAQRHPLIGDVRGQGLYVGVELVADRAARSPAGRHASWVAERMRDHGILLSTDGPDHNVLKIKPPLVFTAGDADRLVATLDRILAEDAARAGLRDA